jgi:hypothetical protein
MFLWAAATGRASVAERLLELGLPIDSTLHNIVPSEDILEPERTYWWPGGTALHQVLLSAQRSFSFLYEEQHRYDRDIFLRLLQRGASPNVTDACRRTPLHIAAREGLVEATHLILAHCNGFSQPDSDGETALKLAVRSSTETAELLLERWMPDDPLEPADLLHRAVWRRDLRLVLSADLIVR